MWSEYVFYRVGRHVEKESTKQNPYPNGKPGFDYLIETIAVIFVIIIFFIIMGS